MKIKTTISLLAALMTSALVSNASLYHSEDASVIKMGEQYIKGGIMFSSQDQGSGDAKSTGLGVEYFHPVYKTDTWGVDAFGSASFSSGEIDYGKWGNVDVSTRAFAAGAYAFYDWKSDLRPYAGLMLGSFNMEFDNFGDTSNSGIDMFVGIEWQVNERWTVSPRLVMQDIAGIGNALVVETKYQMTDFWGVTAEMDLSSDANNIVLGAAFRF